LGGRKIERVTYFYGDIVISEKSKENGGTEIREEGLRKRKQGS
jgi:hypothetical protein